MVSSRILKAMLWAVWVPIQSAPAPAASLRVALMNQAVAARRLIVGGAVSKSVSNGHTVELAGYGAGNVSAVETIEAWAFLVELFDISAAELGGSPTDSEVEIRMEANLRPITQTHTNFMYISK